MAVSKCVMCPIGKGKLIDHHINQQVTLSMLERKDHLSMLEVHPRVKGQHASKQARAVTT